MRTQNIISFIFSEMHSHDSEHEKRVGEKKKEWKDSQLIKKYTDLISILDTKKLDKSSQIKIVADKSQIQIIEKIKEKIVDMDCLVAVLKCMPLDKRSGFVEMLPIDFIKKLINHSEIQVNGIEKLSHLLACFCNVDDDKSNKMVCSPEIAKNLLEIFDENMSKLESCMLDRDFQRQFLSVMYSVNCLLLLNKNVDVSHSKSADVLRNTIIGRYHTLFLCTNILRYVADEERLNILTILGKTFFQDSIVYGYQLVSGLPHTEYPGLLNMLSQKDAWQFIQMFDEQFLREKIESQDNLYRDLGSVFECLPNPNKEAKKFLLDLINNNVLPKSDEKSKETNLKLFDKKAPEVANQNNENSDEENMSKVNHGCSKPQPK